MWENRQQLLSQSLNYQMFLRDAKMGEVALSQQENFLSKVDTPVSAAGSEPRGSLSVLLSPHAGVFLCSFAPPLHSLI